MVSKAKQNCLHKFDAVFLQQMPRTVGLLSTKASMGCMSAQEQTTYMVIEVEGLKLQRLVFYFNMNNFYIM